MPWVSACVQIALLIEGVGLDSNWQSVFVFRASTRDEAFARALALGRDQEATYHNADGEEVRWRLAEITKLEMFESDDLDGVEVFYQVDKVFKTFQMPFETMFAPENSQPIESGFR